MNRYILKFSEPDQERLYQNSIFQETRIFCRISWGILLFLTSLFALLDHRMFCEQWPVVFQGRLIAIFVIICSLTLTFLPLGKKLYQWHTTLFILDVGLFCILLISMGDPEHFSPYFVGIFFAYTGVFITVGIGFIQSLIGISIVLVAFEFFFGFMIPVNNRVFILYNFFMFGMMVVFIFIGYYTEYLSRRNYLINQALKKSTAKVKQLRGLIPICANCKNIRDDNGYWKELEAYLEEYSDVALSHSICPDCVKKLYPNIKLKDQSTSL